MLDPNNLPGIMPGEQMLRIIRQHGFIFVKRIFFLLLLFILPFGFYYIVLQMFPSIFAGYLNNAILYIAASAYFLFIWLFTFFSFIDYFLDLSFITNKRIIDITQKGFFARTVSEQELGRVQDVTSEISGIFPTLFKYGNVYIQTAGEKERFVFENVPRPEMVRDMIIKLVQKETACK